MGAWGVGIWSNDLSCDLREEFRELIAAGKTPEEATALLVAEHGLDTYGVGDDEDPDDVNDFWLGLASVQHRMGRVVADVQQRALAIIDDERELARWPERSRPKRAAVLGKLRATLAEPAPSPKKIRPRRKVDTALTTGQHVVFPLGPGGPEILLRVTGVQEDKGGRYPVAVVVAWDGDGSRAHRLPAYLAPRPHREGEAMGFLLLGEPGDPADLRVLPVVSDSETPAHGWQQHWIVRWSGLHRFFDAEGRPASAFRA